MNSTLWVSSRLCGLLGLLVGWVVPSEAGAAGESCYRDTECVGQQSCIEGACGEGTELPSCTSDDDCEGQDVCSDGYCKTEGVVCRNVAGACWVDDGGGECRCGDGNDSGWSDGFNPDDPPEPPSEEDLAAQCIEELTETCGTEPPSLPDSCVGEVSSACTAYVEQLDALLGLCGEDVPEVNIARVAECCENFDAPGAADYRSCILDIEVGDACPGEAVEACESGGGSDENDGEQAGAGEEDDERSTKAGCRVAAGPSLWVLFLLLGVLARRRGPHPKSLAHPQ